MAYTLEDFCKDSRSSLEADNGPGGRDQMRQHLIKLLTNKEFVAEHCGDDATAGVHTLYQDPDYEFIVLAHINDEPHKSPPHDHGTSWAIYGQTKEYNDMSEYNRVDGGEADGDANLEHSRTYRMMPGDVGKFDVREIHAIDYPAGARFVRVTGRPLEQEPRLRFDVEKGEARYIENRSASG